MALTKSVAEIVEADASGLLGKHPGWERIRLAEVATVLNGFPFDSASFSNESGTPLARIRDVVAGGTRTYFTGGFDSRFLIERGDVLIGMDGDFNAARWRAGPALLNQRVCKVSVEPTFYEPRLLDRALPNYLQAINAETSSVTVKHLSSRAIEDIPLPLPPIAEQRRLADKLDELLSELDAAVAELRSAQRKLAQYRQSLLKAAVEGDLTAEWRAANPPQETGAELLMRILRERRARWDSVPCRNAPYSEPAPADPVMLPDLPAGWVWASVDQLCDVVRGASPRPAGDPRFFGGAVPWITVGSLTADDGKFLESVRLFVTEAGKEASRYVEPGTLLLTNSGATLGVPKIALIGGCINDGSVALLNVPEPLKTYLYWFLTTQTQALRATNQGAAQPNLNTGIVRRIAVPICSLAEMSVINEFLETQVDGVRAQRSFIANAEKMAAAQRQNILRAAFTGQLVPQDPNDEPASALLARIRAARIGASDKPQTRRARKAKLTA